MSEETPLETLKEQAKRTLLLLAATTECLKGLACAADKAGEPILASYTTSVALAMARIFNTFRTFFHHLGLVEVVEENE